MPIEEKILYQFGPYVANTHTETNITGKSMTWAYREAKNIIKKHVHANENDILLFEGSGMTGAIYQARERKGDRIFITPLARKMVREHQLDIETIEGTGGNGRITKRDIERALQEGTAAARVECQVETQLAHLLTMNPLALAFVR